jgi:hypothetical protein
VQHEAAAEVELQEWEGGDAEVGSKGHVQIIKGWGGVARGPPRLAGFWGRPSGLAGEEMLKNGRNIRCAAGARATAKRRSYRSGRGRGGVRWAFVGWAKRRSGGGGYDDGATGDTNIATNDRFREGPFDRYLGVKLPVQCWVPHVEVADACHKLRLLLSGLHAACLRRKIGSAR